MKYERPMIDYEGKEGAVVVRGKRNFSFFASSREERGWHFENEILLL